MKPRPLTTPFELASADLTRRNWLKLTQWFITEREFMEKGGKHVSVGPNRRK
jgi:hypothetical protein